MTPNSSPPPSPSPSSSATPAANFAPTAATAASASAPATGGSDGTEGAKERILIVEDDMNIARTLVVSLKARGFEPRVASTASQALAVAGEWKPAAILLDLGLPDVSGLEVLRSLRRWSDIPVLIVSARHDETGKINALNEGADDYVTKPFSMGELLARLRSTLRRANKVAPSVPEEPEVVSADGRVVVDLAKRQLRVEGKVAHVTPLEWDILVYLVHHRGALVTKTELLKGVWGDKYEKETNYLRVYVSQLRHKIEIEASQPQYLRTEVGVGYRLVFDAASPA